MDVVINLKNANEDGEERTVFDWCYKKGRGLKPEQKYPCRIELIDRHDTGLVEWDVQKLADVERDELVDSIREGMTYQDIALELGINKSTVSRRAKGLVAAGKISAEELPRHGGRRNK